MSEYRKNEYTPEQLNAKRQLYIARGVAVVKEDKIFNWIKSINEIFEKNIDRDRVLELSLDIMQLLDFGVNPKTAADFFTREVDILINKGSICPVEGCIARDVILEYNKKNIYIAKYFPKESFLHIEPKEEEIQNNGTKVKQK